MSDVQEKIKAKVGEYRELYRWLKDICKEWDSYFTRQEKESRCPAVVAQINYIKQELNSFKFEQQLGHIFYSPGQLQRL